MKIREPAKIVAAVEISAAVRRALVDAVERRGSIGWDDDVLLVELGRVFGAFVRAHDCRPSQVEQLVDSIRSVHAGLAAPQSPDAERLVRELCPQAGVEPGRESTKPGPTLQ